MKLNYKQITKSTFPSLSLIVCLEHRKTKYTYIIHTTRQQNYPELFNLKILNMSYGFTQEALTFY